MKSVPIINNYNIYHLVILENQWKCNFYILYIFDILKY